MLQFEELRLRLSAREDEVQEYRQAIGYEGLQRKLAELEEKTTVPGFWNDVEKSQKNQLETAKVKAKLASYDDLSALYEDTLTLIELGNEEEDESVYPEALSDVERFEKMLETQKLTTLLTGQYDANNAIVTFHAGAGGTEAQDWAQMLYRMYTRWAERHGFTYKILDYLDGDEAGLKSASIMIEGENAYGFLRSESGVHRLVRISPFDSSGRRHTSFSSVEVLPELSEDTTVEIRPEDIKMDVFRSSGAGGQHINKTSSDWDCCCLPERAQSASKPSNVYEDADCKANRNQGARAPSEYSGDQRGAGADCMGQPDSFLCIYAVHPGEGHADQI